MVLKQILDEYLEEFRRPTIAPASRLAHVEDAQTHEDVVDDADVLDALAGQLQLVRVEQHFENDVQRD